MNVRDVLRELRELGASVNNVPRTGEVRVSHARMLRPVTFNGRRKDAPRALLVFLRRLSRGDFDRPASAA